MPFAHPFFCINFRGCQLFLETKGKAWISAGNEVETTATFVICQPQKAQNKAGEI